MSHNLHLSKLGDSTNQSGDVSLSDAAGGSQTNLNISMKHFQADKVTAGPQFVNIPGATILLSTDNWAYSWYGSGNRGYISVTPNEPSTAGIEIKLYDESFSLLQTKSGCSHNKAYTFSSLDGKKYYYVEVKNEKNGAAQVQEVYLDETVNGYNTSTTAKSTVTINAILGTDISKTGIPVKWGAYATVAFNFFGEHTRFEEIKTEATNYDWSWDSGKDSVYGLTTSAYYATVYNGYSSYAGYTGDGVRKQYIYAKFNDPFNRTHMEGEGLSLTIPVLLTGPDKCGFKWYSTGEDAVYGKYQTPQYNYLDNGKFTVRGIPGVQPKATSFEFKVYTKSGTLKDTIIPSGYSWASTSSHYDSGTYKITCKDKSTYDSTGMVLSQSQSAWVDVTTGSGTRVKRPYIRAKYY